MKQQTYQRIIVMSQDKLTRLAKRYRGLSRVTSAINDLPIYGVYWGNFPDLVKTLEDAKDEVKEAIRETKNDLASIEQKEPLDVDTMSALADDDNRV
jgi:predicted RNase H-like HicB family nuclease